MTIRDRVPSSWEPDRLELTFCVFCQQDSKTLGHNTISCPAPARNCRFCDRYGHISVVCPIKIEQTYFRKVHRLRKANSRMQKDLLHLH